MYFVFVTTGEKRKNVKVDHLAYQRTTLAVSTRPCGRAQRREDAHGCNPSGLTRMPRADGTPCAASCCVDRVLYSYVFRSSFTASSGIDPHTHILRRDGKITTAWRLFLPSELDFTTLSRGYIVDGFNVKLG